MLIAFPSRPVNPHFCFFFFFNDTATTEIYTLSLHDALPISTRPISNRWRRCSGRSENGSRMNRSEEHTSELQSRLHLVCRLLLEKKKKNIQLVRKIAPHIFDKSGNEGLHLDIAVTARSPTVA